MDEKKEIGRKKVRSAQSRYDELLSYESKVMPYSFIIWDVKHGYSKNKKLYDNDLNSQTMVFSSMIPGW